MLARFESATTPWRRSPFRGRANPIAFGQTYEDCAIELQAFKSKGRVFSIAGAGTTARALAAAGHRVTAVDIDPLQLAYAQARSAGGPERTGDAERLLALGRGMARLGGWTRGKLEEFLSLSDCAQQIEYWDRWLDMPIWRTAVDALLSPRLLRLCYASPFLATLPMEFGREIRQRLRRGWATHPNRSNPYAAALLLGTAPQEQVRPAHPIRFVCADAAEFLESSPPGACDGFALSNIGDGASSQYLRRLRNAVERAAAADAVVVLRSFAEPEGDTGTNRAAEDRSLLWGAVQICPVAEFVQGGALCCI